MRKPLGDLEAFVRGPGLPPGPAFSGDNAIEELEAFKPDLGWKTGKKISLVDHYQDKNGNSKIKGSKNLKQSQSYPIGYLVYKLCCWGCVFWGSLSQGY